MKKLIIIFGINLLLTSLIISEDWWRQLDVNATERENVFEFSEKPKVRKVAEDKYEITFSVKGYCDVTVAIVDPDPKKEIVPGRGIIVRHLASGVLGKNAPPPFQKNSLKQVLYWDGKDDLGYYVKEPLKMKVRVMLGLKPVFDKRLAGSSPANLPGYVFGIAAGPDGVYVFIKGGGSHAHVTVRKFDHNGNYVCSLVPPPDNLPESRLEGMSFIEYEPGKRALHGSDRHETEARDGFVLPGINGKSNALCQPALIGNRLYFANSGQNLLAGKVGTDSALFDTYTDGGTDIKGVKGLPLAWGEHHEPRLCASPDGKRIFMTGIGPCVVERVLDETKGKVFVGDPRAPGSDNTHLNNPVGIDSDAEGRIYVADQANNRIQIFSPEGKYLKTISVNNPTTLRVHQKTGGIYVFHTTRIEGQTVGRLTKFRSFDDPREEFHVDKMVAAVCALDSWTPRPRLWTAGEKIWINTAGAGASGPGLRIWEEEGGTVKLLKDFDEEAKKEAGPNYIGHWSGVGSNDGKVVCDPVREHLYYKNRFVFDLKTGNYLWSFKTKAYSLDDIAFDRYGYMHGHLNPGFDPPGGVFRVDPERRSPTDKSEKEMWYPEIPYDYGIERKAAYAAPWTGVIPVKDQPGAKYFQDGVGVNMRGDVVEQCNIYFAPKMEDEGKALGWAGIEEQWARGQYNDPAGRSYERMMREIMDRIKQGEEVYYIRRQPGIPIVGATAWVYDRSGELRHECAMIAGRLMAGVQIDEDGYVYLTHNRPRIVGGNQFLFERGGVFGMPQVKTNPFLGTFMKIKPKARILLEKSAIPMEPLPARPADLLDSSASVLGARAWVEGAEWFYAGASPIVAGGCSCPTSRFHLDWYKRSYVPEAFRHSIGILDTSGNLIMHLGRYGNFDSVNRMQPGTTDIAMFIPRFISGTDNYLAYEFWGEALIVLRLDYHKIEEISIQTE
jgi:hypothetical protein